jgi:hypothetical protein
MALQEELVLAQMYTHTWAFIVVIMLIAMTVQASKWTGPRGNTAPVAILSVITVLTAVAVALSMTMHAGFDNDGVHDNQSLANAEGASVTIAIAVSVVCFIVMWMLGGVTAPFEVSPTFGYVLFGLIGSAFGMGFLYFRGAMFGEEHRKVVKNRGGVEGYSSKLEKWGFYHIQWHLVGGMFAFLLSIALFVVLKTYFQAA